MIIRGGSAKSGLIFDEVTGIDDGWKGRVIWIGPSPSFQLPPRSKILQPDHALCQSLLAAASASPNLIVIDRNTPLAREDVFIILMVRLTGYCMALSRSFDCMLPLFSEWLIAEHAHPTPKSRNSAICLCKAVGRPPSDWAGLQPEALSVMLEELVQIRSYEEDILEDLDALMRKAPRSVQIQLARWLAGKLQWHEILRRFGDFDGLIEELGEAGGAEGQ